MSVLALILSAPEILSSTSIWIELVSESLLCGGALDLPFELEGMLMSMGLEGSLNTSPVFFSKSAVFESVSRGVCFGFSKGLTLDRKFSEIWIKGEFIGDWEVGVMGGDKEVEGDVDSLAVSLANRLLLI